jgi:hypothetical protein
VETRASGDATTAAGDGVAGAVPVAG